MRMTTRQIDAFVRARRRHEELKTHFISFAETCDYFGDNNCQIPGVLIERHGDRALTASYSTVRLRFQFLVTQAADDALRGKVVVTLEATVFSENTVVLGAFTFNGNGDIDNQPTGDDPTNITAHGIEIVLHHITLALKHTQP